jgi:Fic family protein
MPPFFLSLSPLPPSIDFDTVPVLKALARANRALAELKGRAASILNQGILIDTLALQEARASSEVEDIITTQDEIFQQDLDVKGSGSPAAKEAARHRDALKLGHDRLHAMGGLIINRTLIEMFQLLLHRSGGFRNTPGTALRNELTKEVIYTPPHDGRQIEAAMADLERFVNEDSLSGLDPLIKMALIHHQFETIHPFPDGNGRIGRILNVLSLTRTGLLDIPILYLSRHITRTKRLYYRLLQELRDENAWEAWVLYMLDAVYETARTTLTLVEGIRVQMADVKQRLRRELPQMYSQDMLNSLFRHPYTRIGFVMRDLNLSRQTASKHLTVLSERGILTKYRSGRSFVYVNAALVRLFEDASETP